MKALSAAGITAVLLAIAVPAQASDDHGSRTVSYQALVEYCAKAKPDSRSTATLVGRDGKEVTGIVHCETDYEFYTASVGGDDHGRHHRGDGDRRHDDDRYDD